MKDNPFVFLLICCLILLIPIGAVLYGGPVGHDPIVRASFIFYPIAPIGLYIYIMRHFWAGARTTKDEIILRKPGIIPLKITIKRAAVHNIKQQRADIRTDEGELYINYTLCICLKDGKSIIVDFLPENEMIPFMREAAAPLGTQSSAGEGSPNVKREVQIAPVLILLLLMVGSVALYLYLHAWLALAL